MTADPRHPADSAELDICSSPPGRASVARVRDVLLVIIGEWVHEIDHGELDAFHREHPPATDAGPFDLGYGAVLHPFDYDDAELLMNACQPRGHFFIAKRQYSFRYAYVFEAPADAIEANPYGWDPDNRLLTAMHLSRLVRDNVDSMEFAGRIVDYEDGQKQVIPRHDCELGRAYRLSTGRDWLDHDEATALHALLDAYWNVEPDLPGRVRRALRRTSALATERYVDDRLAEIVIALESLVNTDRHGVTRQFKERVTELGRQLDMPEVTEEFAGNMYRARSEGLHGADIQLFTHGGATPRTEAVEQVRTLEALLRRTVRRALEDPAFRAHFETSESVRVWCPVGENQR